MRWSLHDKQIRTRGAITLTSLLLLAPRLRRPWAVWLAVLVAACSALAPTLSHALAHANAPLGFVICTSSNKLPLAADSPAGPQSAKSFDHCPFCLHSADRVAPPPHPLPYLFLGSGGQQEATARQAFFFIHTLDFAPPPRGPPLPV
jgi:hypothetical protein